MAVPRLTLDDTNTATAVSVWLVLPPRQQVVGLARRFAVHAIALLDLVVPEGDLVLVVSELAANGVAHGHGRVLVGIRPDPDGVVVEVADDGHGWPEIRSADDPLDPRGRGLQVVDALSADWGVRPEGSGKVVWARLGTAAHARRR